MYFFILNTDVFRSSNYFKMALSKLSRGKRIALKFLLAEEIEEEQLVMDMYGKKRAQTHDIFHLRSEVGIFNKLIVQHLREDPVYMNYLLF